MILSSINNKTVWSFIQNGVIIDTSILLELMNGVIKRKRGSAITGNLLSYK